MLANANTKYYNIWKSAVLYSVCLHMFIGVSFSSECAKCRAGSYADQKGSSWYVYV